ncbi:MAG: hypothetical protein IH945_03880 [Armatimonadetes bacterium]|nr:hypothetical protein [Armatimonadota bacterium]
MLATVCLLAMTGVSFVPDWQLESDRAKAVIEDGGKTFVLFEKPGAITLRSLPDRPQERVQRDFKLDESYPSDSAEERMRDLVLRALGEQGRENRVLVLPPILDYLSPPNSVPYMPNFYRNGDPIPYIPNFFKEGDLIPYMPNFFQPFAPFQYLPPAGVRRDEQTLKGLWNRFGKSPIITPLKSSDKRP